MPCRIYTPLNIENYLFFLNTSGRKLLFSWTLLKVIIYHHAYIILMFKINIYIFVFYSILLILFFIIPYLWRHKKLAINSIKDNMDDWGSVMDNV